MLQSPQPTYIHLLSSIETLLSSSRQRVVQHINTTMVQTYREIGKYIVEYEQGGEDRAKYGTGLLQKIADDLTSMFGKGYSYRSLQRFKQFYCLFPDYASSAGIIKLGRTHIVRIMHLKDPNERNFFMIESAKQSWSSRELDRQINSALYHRLALSKDTAGVMQLAQEGQILEKPSDMIKNPYILEFLGLHQHATYSERDLESAIIDNLQMFLLELGKGFSFVARQQRIVAEIDTFYIDLVFYNRLLQCFLLIDLKIGKLTHQDIGQMQMYVNRYDQEVKNSHENKTIGLILCKENDEIIIKYTIGDNQKDQIFSKEYQLYMPNKEELTKLLQE